ncbi:MAG: SufD family Fe-S cluster assembly protein [Hyphomonadaceae bacterium]|nr:SufD family Fe-S cluster assembly protein [Hyphomonadaceae bacterium]
MSTALPNRRVEAWKYSDLAAALPGRTLPADTHGSVIERLAGGSAVVEAAPGAVETVLERFGEEGASLDARATTAIVHEGATLDRIVIQTGGDVRLSHWRVEVRAGGRFRQFIYAEGARLARLETDVVVAGAGAAVELRGAYLVAEGRHADLTSVVHHREAGGATHQLVKGVARAGGRGVFQGKILVAAHAQKTDARQNHHALLLEDGAEAFAKPELEIHADDVACAHGNTVGGLDDMALFYMRSRGLPDGEARALLVAAFLSEAVPESLAADVRDEILGRMHAWLEAGQ